jgi:hypothetical protein
MASFKQEMIRCLTSYTICGGLQTFPGLGVAQDQSPSLANHPYLAVLSSEPRAQIKFALVIDWRSPNSLGPYFQRFTASCARGLTATISDLSKVGPKQGVTLSRLSSRKERAKKLG